MNQTQILIPFTFDPATVDLLLEGLGKLPHDRVRATHDQLKAHAMRTLHEHQQGQDKAAREAMREELAKEFARPVEEKADEKPGPDPAGGEAKA